MAGKKVNRRANGPAKVESIRHKDKRKNIPTEELRDFVAEDENAPKTLLYPRDPSLDPQLVWKGKDEQDQKDLAVPVLPIYIQEKIHPQAIINALPRIDHSAGQLDFFADFNGLPEEFSDRVDFYQHEGNWSNRMILGDSLLVMTSLAEKEGLKGKVQTIYLDPPYGIKFGSNWQVSTRKRDVKDGKAEDATRQPEQVRAFRDTWKLGIHSYLAYLRDRLVVARELLTETGSIFVQIGDENIHLVRCAMDEVFGSEHFCAIVTIAKTAGASSELMAGIADYLLWYAKDKDHIKYRQLYSDKTDGEGDSEYHYLLLPDGTSRSMTAAERAGTEKIPARAERFRPSATTSQRPPGSDPFAFGGRVYCPGRSQYWKTDIEGLTKLGWANRLIPRGESISYLRKLNDFPVMPLNNLWMDTRWGFDAQDKRYVVETNTKVVARALLMTTDPGDLVLDPTCGSGTTAYVAEQWGRRWITIDTSRVALALARTRLMAARYPYYLLADSPEGIRKEAELSGTAILAVKERLRGMGFQPMNQLNHRQDADATFHGQDARATEADATLVIRRGAYLPHWIREGATYNVAFRLADSLPAEVVEAWKREREKIASNAQSQERALTPHEEERLRKLYSEKVEKYLDASHGECWLKDPRLAVIVRDALCHFDGQRYNILAWCVMPNHVHAVVRPAAGHDLSGILHSWKSFTANRINQILGRTGEVWQAESYDHLIRDEGDFQHTVAYVLDNPRAAGLDKWSWCGMGFQPMDHLNHGQDAHAAERGTAFQAVDHGQDAHATGPHGQDAHATGPHGQDARATRPCGQDACATEGDIRKGFVYKRVPHVTLKSIANNPDIQEGMTREQIDAAIARHAETEMLYDQPYEDNKTVRVSGPFTVESLSPHRTISAEEKKQLSEAGKDGWKMKIIGPDAFATMIMENLQKAGVQNTVKGERLKFDSLDPFAGEWIHAEGRYSEKDGTGKRAAVCIGPEHGTVGTLLIKEAAKEAVKGVGFDILLVCGFAFDPSVNEEAKRYGKLTVLPVRMNPDLSMGEDLLKKTGAGNLFMVFGEPDIVIHSVGAVPRDRPKRGQPQGERGQPRGVAPTEQICVEIKGLDVYDPTTGAIRSSSTDDIACWFIDTNYNQESFFVRHAYFTGAEEPYEKLKRALRAEIDEAAWSELYSTTSRPFDPPEAGKIAIKVINHYGDEVLKVYEVKSKK